MISWLVSLETEHSLNIFHNDMYPNIYVVILD